MKTVANRKECKWRSGDSSHRYFQTIRKMAGGWHSFKGIRSLKCSILSDKKRLDLSVLHDDGTNTVAKKSADQIANKAGLP
ncbi:MAG: hypothetical protein GY874_21990 [Desulfobacteraceae bacterium]|nr:hypothetical protein [Desulfobacteraceae bacterium]